MLAGSADDRVTAIWAEIRTKLARWFFFGVTIAVMPIFANALSALSRSTDTSYENLVGRGELLLVSAGIAAAGVGELFARQETKLKTPRLMLVGAGLLLVCLSSYWFADIASAIQLKQSLDNNAIAAGSTVLFGCTLGTSGCSIIVSEIK
ncbi:hypothetical protein [Micromonospora aurantiaca (nom. illeg.)]|uniref:hypothetical protein n=1 Tax=Micromonospora aurantiaca (nom. illeg.) TaxID=47850 RepID=UPI00161B09C1